MLLLEQFVNTYVTVYGPTVLCVQCYSVMLLLPPVFCELV